MNIFSLLWTEIVHRPILNMLLVLVMVLGGSMGLAIVILTAVVRLMMWRTSMAAADMSSGMGDMQPKMQKLQEKYADDPAKQQEEMMKLLKGSGGMFKGCLGMLVQIPVFLGLYRVIQSFAGAESGQVISDGSYSFLSSFVGSFDWTAIDHVFLGIDLLKNHSIVLTILTGILIFAQSSIMKMTKPAPKTPQLLPNGQAAPDMGKMMGFMNYFMVIMMGGVVWSMPSGVGLYLMTTTLFSVAQYGWKFRTLLQAKLNQFFGKKSHPQPEVVESV